VSAPFAFQRHHGWDLCYRDAVTSLDIHEWEDGVIAPTYHVDDWAGALQQLSGK